MAPISFFFSLDSVQGLKTGLSLVDEALRPRKMNRQQWIISSFGLMLLVGSCQSPDAATVPPAQSPGASPTLPVATVPGVAPGVAPIDGSVAVAANPTTTPLELVPPSSAADQPLAVPNLIPPTAMLQRLPQIGVGRSDPFSAVASTPIVIPADPALVSVNALPAVPVGGSNPALPTVTTVPLGNSAPPTVAVPNTVTATNTAPAAVAAPPAELLITGVVQIGDRVSAIVQVPGERSSRYVNAGESLANGRIVVRRIEMPTNQEPRVILVQDGVEIVRTVGGGLL